MTAGHTPSRHSASVTSRVVMSSPAYAAGAGSTGARAASCRVPHSAGPRPAATHARPSFCSRHPAMSHGVSRTPTCGCPSR